MLHEEELGAFGELNEFHRAQHLAPSIRSSLVSFIMSMDILQP